MFTLSIGYPDGEGEAQRRSLSGSGLVPHEVYGRVTAFSQTVETTGLDDVEIKVEDGNSCLHITYCERYLALVIIDAMAPVNEEAMEDAEIYDAFFMLIRVAGRHLLSRDAAHEVMRHYLWHLDRHPGYQWDECRLDRMQ